MTFSGACSYSPRRFPPGAARENHAVHAIPVETPLPVGVFVPCQGDGHVVADDQRAGVREPLGRAEGFGDAAEAVGPFDADHRAAAEHAGDHAVDLFVSVELVSLAAAEGALAEFDLAGNEFRPSGGGADVLAGLVLRAPVLDAPPGFALAFSFAFTHGATIVTIRRRAARPRANQ
jgi:hypothetical protein